MKRRITVTFTEEEWAMIEQADGIFRFGMTHGSRWVQWLIRKAVFVVARAMRNERRYAMPLAVDLRTENTAEHSERLGRPAKNYSPLFIGPWPEDSSSPSGAAFKGKIHRDYPRPDRFTWS